MLNLYVYHSETYSTMEEVVGKWTIDYFEGKTITTIKLFSNQTFYQKAGNFRGKWEFQKPQTLILHFDTLTIPNETGPLSLTAHMDSCFTSFKGQKNNSAYANGRLSFKASKYDKYCDSDSDSPCQVRRVISKKR